MLLHLLQPSPSAVVYSPPHYCILLMSCALPYLGAWSSNLKQVLWVKLLVAAMLVLLTIALLWLFSLWKGFN